MAFQFITGDLSVNKKDVIIERMIAIKEENPAAQIFYLVPEHLKFDMESNLLEEIQSQLGVKHSAMMDLQVVSFTRLVWFLLPYGNQSQTRISDIGLSMLIRQILTDNQNELIVFRGQINYQGFVEKLADLFNELYEGNITPDDLLLDEFEPVYTQSYYESTDNQRLKELQILYSAFIERIKELEIVDYQTYQDLSNYLADHPSMDNFYLIIDHHYYLNAQQMSAVIDLCQSFKQVWMTLPLTHNEAISRSYQPMHNMLRQTYNQIKSLCAIVNIETLPDWDITAPQYNYPVNIMNVAETFKNQQSLQGANRQIVYDYQNPSHTFAQFDSPQTEMKHVSNQIHYLVTEKGYRYQDILIVARDLDRYRSIVPAYFDMNDIPYFYDHVVKMNQHPFVLVLEGILNLKENNYKYPDLMSVIKSELIRPDHLGLNPKWSDDEITAESDHQLNLFENILIANGYFSYRLSDERFEWRFDVQDQIYINHLGEESTLTIGEIVAYIRDWLLNAIIKPLKAWKTKKILGAKAAQLLYNLVNKAGIKEQWINLRDKAIEEGDIEASRRHEQVWDEFIQTLDEFYTLYGSREIVFDNFSELILTGLNESTYHIIPPTLDQVTFTNMESPQTNPYKICFIVGADENLLPRVQEFESLLPDKFREKISEHLLPYQFLLNHEMHSQSQEVLLTYQILLNATTHIYISYASSVKAVALNVSPYLQALVDAYDFNVLSFNGQTKYNGYKWQTSDFGKYLMQQRLVLQNMRHSFESNQLLSNLTLDLIHLMNSSDYRPYRSLADLVQATFKFNQLPTHIKPETALQLFGKNINASVSKIEQYYQDPYSHFLIHGLRLQEREVYDINYAKSGDYFHEFLDLFMKTLNGKQLNLANLSDDDFNQLYVSTMQTINENEYYNILASHPRFEAIKYQLDQQLNSFLNFSRAQNKYVQSTIERTEAVFDQSTYANLKGFNYPLTSGGQLTISGKIDRIDRIERGNDVFLQVIDYKSSYKNFDLVDAFYGLDLQVITYLSVALNNYPTYKPLGAFYQPIVQKSQEGLQEIISNPEANSLYQLNKNKLQGFITLDEEEMRQVEPMINETNTSLVYPVDFKKNGEYKKTAKFFSEEEVKLLLDYSHYLFKRAAEQMQSGDIRLRPFKENQYTPSLTQPYRVIAGFDATENYEAYRSKTIKKENVLNKIKEILNNQGGDIQDD